VASVELQQVWVHKGERAVLRGIDLTVDDGEVVALVGTTGSGKTTLLRTVAGLERVTSGAVVLGGVDMTTRDPRERGVAYVAEQPALQPNRSVRRNIEFPLRLRRDERARIDERVTAEAQAMRLTTLLDRSPKGLSAGEARAVQIARAMLRDPEVLLLDQPFADLDPDRARALRREVGTLRRGHGITTLIATNDVREASACDRIAVVEAGRISQCASPREIHDHPRTAAAAAMTGDVEVFDVAVSADREGNGTWLEHGELRIRSWRPALAAHHGRRLQLLVRPAWWERDERSDLRLVVAAIVPGPASRSVWCRVGHRRIVVTPIGGVAGVAPGDTIGLRLVHYVLLDPRDGFPVRDELDAG
jgi:ABC-type sugar transport system ATPase subunit